MGLDGDRAKALEATTTDEAALEVDECRIKPSDTAASSATVPPIDDQFGNHCVYRASGNPQKLFVFLGATHAAPSSHTLIGKAAASAGLHSIGLAYVNPPKPGLGTVEGVCDDWDFDETEAANCAGNIREEQLLGNDTSQFVQVTPPTQ